MLICNDWSHSAWPAGGAEARTPLGDGTAEIDAAAVGVRGPAEEVAATDPGELPVAQPAASSAIAADETAIQVRQALIALLIRASSRH
ncbi:MAG TPA: hypothetical protein VNV62_11585 [Trebonia sp.]|nr:hypothetical protein [Trebonia sp.]